MIGDVTGGFATRLSALVAGVMLLGAVGCTGDTDAPGSTSPGAIGQPAATRTVGPDVIDFTGLRGIRFGDGLAQLSAQGVVSTAEPYCGSGYSFTGIDAASPVFDQDRLVLVWADPPLHTPEDVSVGSPVDQARRAYPDALELTPPAGSTTYPGLLIAGGGDRAYLLLHDGRTVQKLVAGLERYVRLLYDTGFGSC